MSRRRVGKGRVRRVRETAVTPRAATGVRSVGAAEFKARCLELMEDVRERGGEIVITKYGEPVAKLVPVAPAPAQDGFGILRGTVTYLGDIVAPTGERWNAEED
ncbi:MAG: type II toxin-antitoxin system Phd/YefM family antitoxin [Gemmatimonadales bacterium]